MKRYQWGFLPMLGAIGCWGAYHFIGAKIGPDGILIEPFFLIPIGYILMTVGIIGSAVGMIVDRRNQDSSLENR